MFPCARRSRGEGKKGNDKEKASINGFTYKCMYEQYFLLTVSFYDDDH